MSYSIKRAALIADQLERLATQNVYQLAGQLSNLEFWISESVHAIGTLDDYPARFLRLREAQIGWVRAHGTRVSDYCPYCGGACEFGPSVPDPPSRIPVESISAARDAVRRGGRRYLRRLYRARLLDDSAFRQALKQIGLEAEKEDLDHG